MHPSIEKLLHVQRVDKDTRFLTKAKEARPKELEDERKKVELALGEVAVVTNAIKDKRIEIDQGELAIREQDAVIEKAKIALNSAKTNQEYGVFKEQISRHEEERGGIEEQVLEYLTQIDGFEEVKAEREKDLAAQQKIFERKAAEVAEIVQGLDTQIDALTVERGQLTQGVDPDHLVLYDRILAYLGDVAICPVTDEICQGCFRQVTKQDISTLMLSEELLQCRNCDRLLFLG